MKLGTLNDGTRDGRVVVVSRDLTRCTDASFLARTLQAALDDWQRIAPHLSALAQSLEVGSVPAVRFHEHDALSSLPRAYQHIGCADAFRAPREPVSIGAAKKARVEVSLAVLCGDVGETAAALEPKDAALLVGLAATIVVGEAAATTSLSPVVVTPDDLDADLPGWQSALPQLSVNGKSVDAAGGGEGKIIETLIAGHAALRPLTAGAIVVVPHPAVSAQIAVGDTLRASLKDRNGHSIFGAIEQKVEGAGA